MFSSSIYYYCKCYCSYSDDQRCYYYLGEPGDYKHSQDSCSQGAWGFVVALAVAVVVVL